MVKLLSQTDAVSKMTERRAFGWYAGYDGCAYYRVIKPLKTLMQVDHLIRGSKEGWDNKWDILLPNDWPEYDVIIGQRVCMAEEDGGPAHKWMEITKDSYTLTVYEIDDDLFNLDPSNPGYTFFNDPNTQQNIKSCAGNADLVTVSTEPLREVMLKYNPNVRVIPNYVDESLLDIVVPHDSSKLIIGWAGSATHSADFKVIGDGLSKVIAENNETMFMTIGGVYGSDIPRNRIIRYPWTRSTERLFPQISRFDIGIAPLKPHQFNESKSHIKVLEYAALGIPVVASNYGPYKEFVEHGVTGFLANTPEEWREYLQELVSNDDLRHRMGADAIVLASEHTFQQNIQVWANALTS